MSWKLESGITTQTLFALSHQRKFYLQNCHCELRTLQLEFIDQQMSSGAAEPVKRHRCVMFTCSSAGKESACNVGGLASIPGSGRSPGEGKGYPLQYSGLENTTDCIVHGVAKSRTQLSNFQLAKMPLVASQTAVWQYESPLLLPPKQPLYQEDEEWLILYMTSHHRILLLSRFHANTSKCNINLLQKSSSKIV